jgi:hypothetical protein
VPNIIITGNGIKIDWASVGHSYTNGQVQRVNGMVLQGLMPRIFDQLIKFAGRWVQELPGVLWILKTTPNWSKGFTSFFLTYGMKAVLPTHLGHGAPRVKAFDPNRAIEAQQDMVNLLDEARETTLVHLVKY